MDPDSIVNLLIVMVVAATVAWLGSRLIRARQPHPANEPERLGAQRQVELLSDENAGLKRQVGRLEERIAVLERIATDPAERTAREIDQLR